MATRQTVTAAALAAGAAILVGIACGGGGSYPPTNPTPNPGGTVAATITIKTDGTLEPNDVRIEVGQQVRFMNQDTRSHEVQSNPHMLHTDCPAINQVAVLTAGASRTTAAFTAVTTCGFHDHLNPDTVTLRGTIRVGVDDGTPGPTYIKP